MVDLVDLELDWVFLAMVEEEVGEDGDSQKAGQRLSTKGKRRANAPALSMD